MKIFGFLVTLLSCAILGNGQRPLSFLEPNCGSKHLKYNPRIINGESTSILEHPWMAFVSSKTECDSSSYGDFCRSMCGGSLITASFVLSAAHCDFNRYTTIKLGEFSWKQSTANGIEIPAVEKINHPGYDRHPNHPKNDIALYRLARRVTYTNYIRPVCLPTNFNPLPQISYLTATGWGNTEYGTPSDGLRKGTIKQIHRSTCSLAYGVNVDMSQICVGESSSATCSGDSGGPITAFYPTKNKQIVIQLGIVSYGAISCRSFGVYTNVMHYIGWIMKTVRRGGYQNTIAPNRRPNKNHRQTTRAPNGWTVKPPYNYYIDWTFLIPKRIFKFHS